MTRAIDPDVATAVTLALTDGYDVSQPLPPAKALGNTVRLLSLWVWVQTGREVPDPPRRFRKDPAFLFGAIMGLLDMLAVHYGQGRLTVWRELLISAEQVHLADGPCC